MSEPVRSGRRSAGVRAGLAAAGLITLLLVATPRLLTSLVVEDDVLEAADLIYVLSGRYSTRVALASRLYREGFAARVVLAETRERVPFRWGGSLRTLSELIAMQLVRSGVPDAAIGIIPYPGGVVNTRDEARALRQHLEHDPARRVIVVTTDYHTGRARRTLLQELRGRNVDLMMAAARNDRDVTPRNWWKSWSGAQLYGGELAKQIGVILGL